MTSRRRPRSAFDLPGRLGPRRWRGWGWPAILVVAAAATAAGDAGGRSPPGELTSDAGRPLDTRRSDATGPQEEPRSAADQQHHRLREGAEVDDQVGRFEVSGDRVVFVSKRIGQRLVVLENLALQRIARSLAERPQPSQWKVSGTITEFRGANFILLRRATLQGASLLDSHPDGAMMGKAPARPMPAGTNALPPGPAPIPGPPAVPRGEPQSSRWQGHRHRSLTMTAYRHLVINQVGDATVVHLRDARITDDANIQELGQELFHMVEVEKHRKLVLNFAGVDFLSSAALGKLITLEKRVKAHSGQMKLCSIRPQIHEVFVITKLDRLFDIRKDEADALATFSETV